ncbi:acetyl/propionyl/methylcrotonyl-CoA carboxylase subunit alpha [Palleronia pelagia]|uniref:3-methylcrotonoyl-CoA carboxylase, alpha subunit n=1 Tax=Palleronia pelagia TaxID=387096 RepID=A0A1H8A8L5_9RHOB|nr:biotin carboxylase N-terminal domain-containing protein [Palleronia pelagia]SEM66254.1 3-methylcrotonoyl-CoA carboxylase, alpha subunit [Palleronia pelagia]
MFRTILIANRGEIACRVIDTCRRLGIATVAVYSDADAGARHVCMADRAVHIGGAAPAESYLRGDAIIAAALATGAEAIHPGYGFLSENPDFVDAVEAAGLVFIGPSADAIRAMGLKDAAKALMVEAGVPVVPGYHGSNQEADTLAKAADEIGYPVLIKAVAGGGGKGMRRVDRAADFAAALESARSEARNAFGNDAVLVEKFVSRPRHIEVQVFGDGIHALHLFERDCSLQRRHQKVVEEAPAPGMSESVRAAMGAAAVRAAEAIGYAGAGTVEFIVDGGTLDEDSFYFMEMNTRLQVEHPVTEAITGHDLVEWQLRVAAGEGLPVAQDALAIRGHAVEVRLYAEDVAAGFLPATGTLAALRFPEGLRVETGVREGDTISPHYDPMIAKLIAHGDTRDAALGRMARGLESLVVGGTVTNKAFLQALVDHEGFSAGQVDTGLIDRDLAALTQTPAPGGAEIAMAALAALGLGTTGDRLQGFALWKGVGQPVVLAHGDDSLMLTVLCEAGQSRVVSGMPDGPVRLLWQGDAWWVDGRRMPAALRSGALVVVPSGPGHAFRVIDPLDRDAAAGPGADVVQAPMPGLLRAVHVAEGADVAIGDALAVLEAMKMEHVLRAERAGKIAEILVNQGSQVAAGDALIRLAEI